MADSGHSAHFETVTAETIAPHPMNTDINTLAYDHHSQAAKDLYQSAATRVEDVYHTAAHRAEDLCKTAAARAEDTLVQSKQYVRENPISVILGAFTIGLALGCMLSLTHHTQPTLRERFRW